MGTAVSFQNVRKTFGALCAIDDISLEIEEGEFFGLLGPNGAGKTTLISCLAGLARADSGDISVMGFDVVRDYRETRRRLGVVPQELVFDPFFTVRETLRIQSGYFGVRKNDAWINELLENLDLSQKADVNLRSLSGGMKRRVLIAQALVHKPQVIVLDEPTAGVDVELRQILWQFIRRLNREGHTVILTTHYLEEAESLCERIAMLNHGRIVALDTTRNLLSENANRMLSMRLKNGNLLPETLRGRAVLDKGAWVFRLNTLEDIEPLLAAVRESAQVFEELQLVQTDLEDVFVRVMHANEGSGEGNPKRGLE
ncbi:MAG: ABC transporter ATP-binding protein [Candidatus Accumulibacter sp.]|jgi:ABC-2 type transport system ATP-binding protein|nr:ABC transporter ATP-binding protein [Accumulibacter sp.]